jgi:hypothetical protein
MIIETYHDPDRAGLNDEHLDNTYLAEAFPNADSPAELYRQVYKWTACGAYLSVRINYFETIEPDGFHDYPSDIERSEWVHCGDLHKLGSWKDLDEKGILITALLVGSIVEGVDYGTDDIELEINQLDEEPEAFNKRFYAAIDEVEAQALSIWNETHGCDTCLSHWAEDSGITEQELLNTWDSVPVWKDCHECQGHGMVI